MSSTETLLQAAINRLSARVGQKLMDTAAEIAVIAQDAPERMRKEWELFEEEVIAEADRLETESMEEKAPKTSAKEKTDATSPQEKIDLLRAKVAELNRKIEGMD